MNRIDMINAATATANDVFIQWSRVFVDWTDVGTVRTDLDAHLGASMANLDEGWSGADEDEYRNLVARELKRMRDASEGIAEA